MSTPIKRTYGYIRDIPDPRDYVLAECPRLSKLLKDVELPEVVDMRSRSPAVYDQGSIGSCTGQSLAYLYQYDVRELPSWIPSRLFIYYQERVIMGTVKRDSGAHLRDGIKALAKWGVCRETTWPYIENKFATKPSMRAYLEARKNKILGYYRVDQSLNELRRVLAINEPIAFGFDVFPSFETIEVARTGVAQMPKPGEKSIGGHAVALVGYDHPSRRFIVRNSWGVHWGQQGYFTMPYDYILNPDLAADFWVIDRIK